MHSIAGFKQIARSVSLAGNSEYYIWCFGQGDDGVEGYISGYINVFGLQI